MNESVIALPAPTLAGPPVRKYERERAAFWRLWPELVKTYDGQFVAIHQEQVLDSDRDELALIARVLHRVGNVAIFVECVTNKPRPLTRV